MHEPVWDLSHAGFLYSITYLKMVTCVTGYPSKIGSFALRLWVVDTVFAGTNALINL
jgi:hypothetical protein